MGSESIILPSPSLYQYLCLLEAGKEFSIEQLVPEFSIEGFVVAVLPGTPWFNEEVLDPELLQPLTNCLCRKLGSIVRPEMDRETLLEKLFSKDANDILGLELSPHLQRQTFPAVFINQRQDPERPAIVSPVSHEIIGPDMVFEQGLQTEAGSIIEP